ncbi:putative NAD(FAD)-dependent dehydrogenases [Nocardioides sp. J9]|nr:putative NAD(FAD)-dependent dehydrogenases [Nocardioides sp. J9]
MRYLRTMDDATALRADLSGSILVVGAGWIGLEVAAAAREAGAAVTVVESAPLPLGAVLGPELATVFADLHREHGVDLRLATSLASVDHTGGRTTSPPHPSDRTPAGGWATDNGVLVNSRLRASDPHVFAAGDVARQDHPLLGPIRVEHWDTAIHQGRHAARVMLGEDAAYDRQPYFFTDQYDLGMEYVGHTGRGYDEVVVRGDRASRVLTALWVKDSRVVAGMHLNDWDAIDPIRTWVGRPATPQLRDTSIALADVPLVD